MPISTTIRPPRRRAVAVALACAFCITASVGPSAASARSTDTSVVTTTASGIEILETDASRQTCTAPELVSAFASLGDTRDYVLAPGGDFEDWSLDGWQVQRAGIADGGSPLEVQATEPEDADHSGRDRGWGGYGDDDGNEQSLRVPAGGSATSPAMCVDLHYPTFRLMTRPPRGQGQLKVEVIYPDSDNPVFHPVATLGAQGRDWIATDDLPVFPERGGAAPGMRRVALRFTSVATGGYAGEWRIDDLYVDPKRL
jgi:hypothetical protein